ncbi:MAG: hypothetical protein U0271_11690 [Polyangiaceae bacterium]
MKLLRVMFLGVRGLADATHDLVHPASGRAHSFVVVTGPAASGKTRLLEAILFAKNVIGSYGSPAGDPSGFVRGEDEAAKIALTLDLSDEERAFAGVEEAYPTVEALLRYDALGKEAHEGVEVLFERYDHDPRHGKFEYFPANRQLLPYGTPHGLDPIEQGLLRTGSDVRKYSFVPRLLATLSEDAKRAAEFDGLLAELAPTLRRTPADPSTPWACLTSRGRAPVAPSSLSSAETDAVIFAATAALTRLSHSIVLVDRPELYVEPARVAAFVGALRALGTDNQLIVATNNAEVVSSVEPSQLIRLS